MNPPSGVATSSKDVLGHSSPSFRDNIKPIDAVTKLDQEIDIVTNLDQGIDITWLTTSEHASQACSRQEVCNIGNEAKNCNDRVNLADGIAEDAVLDIEGNKTMDTVDITGCENEPVLSVEEKTVKLIAATAAVNPRKTFLKSEVNLSKVKTSSRTFTNVNAKHKPAVLNTKKSFISSAKVPRVGCTSQQGLGHTKIIKKPESKSSAPRFPISLQTSKPTLTTAKFPSIPSTKSRKRKSIGVKVENNGDRSTIISWKPKPNLNSVNPKVVNTTTIKSKTDNSTINPPVLSARMSKPKTVVGSTSSAWQRSSAEPASKLTQSKSFSALKTPSMPRISNRGLSRSTSVASKMSQPKTEFTAPRTRNKQESQGPQIIKPNPNSVLKTLRSPVPSTSKSKTVLPSVMDPVRRPLFRGARDCDCKQVPTMGGRVGARRKPGNGV